MVFILNKVEVLEDLLREFNTAGNHGATILTSTGMARALHGNDEESPLFGSLRALLDPGRAENRTILIVLRDEQVHAAVSVIQGVVGDLNKPDTGIVFTLPIDLVEGVRK